jgi:hypothetical protein
MKYRPIIATAGIVAGLSIAACGPPPAVHALLQRTACNTTHVAPMGDACTHWINRNPAWGYPANTEWVGPWYDYSFDLSHGNGAELMP